MVRYLIAHYKKIALIGFSLLFITPLIWFLTTTEPYTMFNYGILSGAVLIGIGVIGKLQDDKIKELNKV